MTQPVRRNVRIDACKLGSGSDNPHNLRSIHGAAFLRTKDRFILGSVTTQGNVIITTNLEFSRWTEMFPDAMLTAALIDRLTHRSHILDMNGDSYRLKESLGLNSD
jgi:hypothetical protein